MADILTLAPILFPDDLDLTYTALKMKIANEQRLWESSLYLTSFCVWCGKYNAVDLHHWLLKRGAGMGHIPDEILNQPINVVLAHNDCHQKHGQTKLFRDVCFLHKFTLGYRPHAWVADLLRENRIKHVPEIVSPDLYVSTSTLSTQGR